MVSFIVTSLGVHCNRYHVWILFPAYKKNPPQVTGYYLRRAPLTSMLLDYFVADSFFTPFAVAGRAVFGSVRSHLNVYPSIGRNLFNGFCLC